MQFIPLIVALVLAPLLRGVINRTKASFAGRRGPPLLQPYSDLAKLLRKGAVYSHTSTFVFRAGPIVTLAGLLAAAALVPLGSCSAAVAFPGDLVLFVYLLALGRFFTVAAALDTGSSFEGMGSSREVFFSALAEPSLLLGLAAVRRPLEPLRALSRGARGPLRHPGDDADRRGSPPRRGERKSDEGSSNEDRREHVALRRQAHDLRRIQAAFRGVNGPSEAGASQLDAGPADGLSRPAQSSRTVSRLSQRNLSASGRSEPLRLWRPFHESSCPVTFRR